MALQVVRRTLCLLPARAADPAHRPIRWSQVAGWSGRVVHPQVQWEAICRPDRPATGARPWSMEPEEGVIPTATRRALSEILAARTSAPERCWMCVWDGFGGMEDIAADLPRVELPHRSHVLLHAPLKAFGGESLLTGPPLEDLGPSLWWPDDRAWCVATEIDFRWTYVGGSRRCIAAVLDDARLEALPTDVDHRGDYLGDTINGPVRPWG
jgi:hypothetical protein